jgi:hypothetical protein
LVLGTVQLKELNGELGGMGRLNSSFASGSEELFDPTMPEALDHAYSVALQFSLVKHIDPHSHINRSASTSTTTFLRGTPAASA